MTSLLVAFLLTAKPVCKVTNEDGVTTVRCTKGDDWVECTHIVVDGILYEECRDSDFNSWKCVIKDDKRTCER